MNGTRTCIMPNCDRSLTARSLCKRHYEQAAREGLLDSFPKNSLAGRLQSGLGAVSDNGCVEWTRYRTRDGYGRIRAGGRVTLAHRVAWELANGTIPDGLEVCHRCDNPPCCNVSHLFLGTHSENIADRDAKGRCRSGAVNNFNGTKRACKRGHEFTAENTISRGQALRICRICERWRTQAKRRGMSIADFIADIVAADVNL